MDECATNPCTADTNSDGTCTAKAAPDSGYTCGCKAGFEWSATNKACQGERGCQGWVTAPARRLPWRAAVPSASHGLPAPVPALKPAVPSTWPARTPTHADIDGCSATPCAADANSDGKCEDVPAPDTGFKCGCKPGFTWSGTACQGALGAGGENRRGLRCTAVAAALALQQLGCGSSFGRPGPHTLCLLLLLPCLLLRCRRGRVRHQPVHR